MVEIRRKVAHDEYEPTVEEAIISVRTFFEAWETTVQAATVDVSTAQDPLSTEVKTRLPISDSWKEFAKFANSEKAKERQQSIISAFEKLIEVMHGLNLHSFEIDLMNLMESLRDVAQLSHRSPPLLVGGGATHDSLLLLNRSPRPDYMPTKEEAAAIIEKCYRLIKTFRRFAEERRDERRRALRKHRRVSWGPYGYNG